MSGPASPLSVGEDANEAVHRRLLDLLAGWEQYLGQCASSEEAHPGVTKKDYDAERRAVAELYQKAGVLETMTSSEVVDFLGKHVLSVLLVGESL